VEGTGTKFAEIEKLRGCKEQKKTREATKAAAVQLHKEGKQKKLIIGAR